MDATLHDSMLADLRRDTLAPTLLLLAGAGLAIAALDITSSRTTVPWAFGLVLLGLMLGVWQLSRRSYSLAAWATNLTLPLLIVWAWYWFPESNLQHAFFLPMLGAAIMLGGSASIAVAAESTILLLAGAALMGPGASRVAADIIVLWLGTGLMGIGLRIQRVTVAWAWQGYEEERQQLAQARDRQMELKQALGDLALARSETDRLNRLLSAASQALEQARRAKEEFVANVSHELRTPLNMIIGFSEMISSAPELYARHLPPALLADVAAIQRNSQHLSSLVNDVLDLAEAEAGRTQLSPETVPIGEIIGEAVEAVAALFQKKGLRLDVALASGLPPVYCDRTRIRQVILNLLSNAGRFTEQGGVRVETALERDMVQVTVTDTGPGMDASVSARLFQPFQQDQAMRRRFGGTGLGLAISKRFVELHGGRIGLESTPGQGTRVHFQLPLAPAPADKVQRWFSPYHDYTPRDRPSKAPHTEARPCVAVVEQGRQLAQLVRRYVDDMEVVSVPGFAEAAHMVEAQGAQAIVINEAASLATGTHGPAMRFDVPVLHCSLPEGRAKVGDVVVQEYLVKPITRAVLLETLRGVAPGARTVLLADDDPEALQLFGRVIASAPERYVSLQAEDGEVALRLMRERRPDVVLLDLLMPNVDGRTVLALKAQEEGIRGIPVIVTSAQDMQNEPVLSEALVLTRPRGLSARDLALAVRALTDVLQPRFGAAMRPETPPATPACG